MKTIGQGKVPKNGFFLQSHNRKMRLIKQSKIQARYPVKKQYFIVKKIKVVLKVFVTMLFVFILSKGGVSLYQQAMTSPFFKISKLEIKGNRVLNKSDIKQLLGPVFGKNIFRVNLNSVIDRLSGNPWIESAVIRRKFPNSLIVQTTERVPFAKVVTSSGEKLLTDRKAFLIKKIESWDYKLLPSIHLKNNFNYQVGSTLKAKEITNGINFIGMMSNMKRSDLISNFTSITIDEAGRLVLNTPFANILFSPGGLKNNLKKLDIASRIIQKERLKVRSIDLTFNDQVVLQLL